MKKVFENLNPLHHTEVIAYYALSALFLAMGDTKFKNAEYNFSGNSGLYTLACFAMMLMRWVRKQIKLQE